VPQTQKGNALLALSCYTVLLLFSAVKKSCSFYRDGDVGATHAPIDWQVMGPGTVIRGPGSVTATEWCEKRIFELAGASDAQARPAMATNKAKKRIKLFIFGNLSSWILKGDCSPL
jgi:hypothetical protein